MNSKTWLWVLGVLVILFIAWTFGARYILGSDDNRRASQQRPGQSLAPQLDNQFGFLGSPNLREYSKFADTGAGWVRPHAGPFTWGEIQSSAGANYNFGATDDLVRNAAQNQLSILATIWPYADWDQQNRSDASDCISDDEFAREIGHYRCNPNDWDSYAAWITALVERYDGDGVDDLENSPVVIKHWEVNNEPDLTSSGLPPLPGGSQLTFFVGDASDYAELLKKTSAAIKAADPDAKVVIAGASGGNSSFMSYWKEVLADKETHDAFDIANVHCISNDEFESFNVEPYKAMLSSVGLTKPIWVTEAEAFVTSDTVKNATQVRDSSQRAFELGAERLFYTALSFDTPPGGGGAPAGTASITADNSLDLGSPVATYQQIFSSLTTPSS